MHAQLRAATKHGLALLMALLLGSVAIPKIASATVQPSDPSVQPLPILVLNCQEDPGEVSPGGGRGVAPEALREPYGCEPAAGVAVTVYNLDIDFGARCDTDEVGTCTVQAPPDPQRRLTVAVHTASVDPAFAPVEPLGSTVHYTEFTGVGIVNLPTPPGTPTAADERQLLSVNLATCDGTDCTREPVVSTLAQVSAGEITSRGAPWLATDEEGNVTFDVSALEGESIDVMLEAVPAGATEPRFACSDLDSGQRLDATWVNGREGSFIRVPSLVTDDIRCDITLARAEGAA